MQCENPKMNAKHQHDNIYDDSDSENDLDAENG
jgi:hypothetical protein